MAGNESVGSAGLIRFLLDLVADFFDVLTETFGRRAGSRSDRERGGCENGKGDREVTLGDGRIGAIHVGNKDWIHGPIPLADGGPVFQLAQGVDNQGKSACSTHPGG